MTSTLFILIILLSATLLFALYTLKQRTKAVHHDPIIYPRRQRVITSTAPSSDLQLSLPRSLHDDLVLSTLLQPKLIEELEGERQCEKCSRLYDERSKYCYVDGALLRSRLPFSVSFWVCTRCGHEGDSPCACDESIFQVQSEPESSPMIPSARCSICQDLGSLGSVCGVDHVERTPVFEINFRTFPPQGFGPRRSICLKCGSQFSSSAKFCSSDGHRLSLLN